MVGIAEITLPFTALTSTVMEAMSAPSWLERMHPFVRSHRSGLNPKPGQLGHHDQVEYYSGLRLERVLCLAEDAVAAVEVDIYLGKSRVAKCTTTMAFEDQADGSCLCTVSIERDTPFNEEELALQKDYIKKMLRGFEYYLTTGKPVERNQFGAHPLYSSADA
jgi:hypothetical protein